MKPALYYKSRQSEIDTSLLRVIPEATRVSRTKYPKNWDWRILESDSGVIRTVKRTPKRNPAPESEKKTKKSSPVCLTKFLLLLVHGCFGVTSL